MQSTPSLFKALKKDDNLESFKAAIKSGANVNEKSFLCSIPILWRMISSYWDYSCCSGLFTKESWEEAIRLLLDHKANINIRTKNKRTLLHEAAMIGSGVIVNYLIERGMDVNEQDKSKKTPLHDLFHGNSVKIDCLDTLEKLILAGANINARTETLKTPLHYATYIFNEEKSKEIIPCILFYGADFTSKDISRKVAKDYTNYEDIKDMLKDEESVRNAIIRSKICQKELGTNIFRTLKGREYTGSLKKRISFVPRKRMENVQN
jgi:hypothetical protein